jgi:hypothetical protein
MRPVSPFETRLVGRRIWAIIWVNISAAWYDRPENRAENCQGIAHIQAEQASAAQQPDAGKGQCSAGPDYRVGLLTQEYHHQNRDKDHIQSGQKPGIGDCRGQ